MGTSALLLTASNKSAGASDDSDVPAAATLQARSFASALTYSAEAPDPRPGSCIAGLPARGPWSVAGGSSCGSTVHAAPGLPCPRWHTHCHPVSEIMLWLGRILTHKSAISAVNADGDSIRPRSPPRATRIRGQSLRPSTSSVHRRSPHDGAGPTALAVRARAVGPGRVRPRRLGAAVVRGGQSVANT